MAIDWLTLVTFFPIVGVIIMLFIPSDRHDTLKGVSLIIAFITMFISFGIYYMFDTMGNGMQFEINKNWIMSMGINYHVGIDGISLLLIVLTTLLTVLCIISSWKSITVNVKGYYISMLILSTGMIGVFCALDLFLFYVFWEVMLIPMYFIIGIWGGPRKIYAAIKFVLFTMFGSLLMLVALLFLYFEYARYSGEYTFDLFQVHLSKNKMG